MREKIANIQAFNDKFADFVEAGQVKEAALSAQGLTRDILRENSFTEKVFVEPSNIQNDELDKSEDPELHVKWVDREPSQAPAINVPLNSTAEGFQFKGTRYPVFFHRKISPKMEIDIDRLRGYDYDIREVLMEQSTKELGTSIDASFIEQVNRSIGLVNTANPLNQMGLEQYKTIGPTLNRATLADAMNIIKRLRVPFGPMQPDGSQSRGCMLMNNITASELLKMERGEVGGDEAQRAWKEGTPTESPLGVPLVTTIKRELVPDGTVYFFSAPEFLGRYLRLQPLTVWMKNEAYFTQWQQWLNIGISIGNVKGVTRVDFVD
jgi:hypothetical protein